MYNNKKMIDASLPDYLTQHLTKSPLQRPLLTRARMPVNPATLIEIGVLSKDDIGE